MNLFPAEDTSSIATAVIIDAPEVNLASRIAGPIALLDLLEGASVERGQIVCQIEELSTGGRRTAS
jgi:hypothetical protein